jgi:hypothetical protein
LKKENKKGGFIDKEKTVETGQKEKSMQRKIFSELKGVKDSNKKAILD